MSRSNGEETFTCPNCGAEVRVGRKSCPECGSDEQTGWSEEANEGFLDLPAGYGEDGDSFDYDDYIAREFGGKDRGGRQMRSGGKWIAVAAAMTLIAFLFLLVQSFFF